MRFLMLAAALSAAAMPLTGQAPAQNAPADLIVTASRIYTVDPARPLVQAFAVRGGRIVFAGSAAEALTMRGPATRVMELGTRTVIPGMVDAHAHLTSLGQALATVDLTGTQSYDEVIARVAARARTARPGEWIRGRGWNQNEWADTRFPTHDALSAAVPDNPVVLARVDGHALLVNAAAIRLAQVTGRRVDVTRSVDPTIIGGIISGGSSSGDSGGSSGGGGWGGFGGGGDFGGGGAGGGW